MGLFDPVRWLFRNGPWPYFWQGAQDHEICAAETQVGAVHWIQHPQECEDLIERKVISWQGFWLIGITFVYFNFALCSFLCSFFANKYIVEPVFGKKHLVTVKD